MAGPKTKVAAALLTLSLGGLAFISQNEGREHVAYQDQTGTWTICDGHTRGVKQGQVATDAQCDAFLREDSAAAQAAVRRLVKTAVTQDQFDALVDFVFNVGETNFASSTLLREINADRCGPATAEFVRWNKSKGRVLPGLTTRRGKEANRWSSGC